VNRFAYVQIKKVGGGGTSKADEICTHAAKYATTLKRQLDLYRPHLVLGCGVGRDSPARLFGAHVLPGGRKTVTDRTSQGAPPLEYPRGAPRLVASVSWRASRAQDRYAGDKRVQNSRNEPHSGPRPLGGSSRRPSDPGP
jgi:hypothetical protein